MSNEHSSEFTSWVLTGIVTVVGALTTALVFLFRKTEYDNAKAIERLEHTNVELKQSLDEAFGKADKCEEDRHALFTACELMKAQLKINMEKIAYLESKISRIDATGTKFENEKHQG